MSTISLIKSAFGGKATLYTVLNCTKTSSQSELRSAYRKAALRFHPDRANAVNNDDGDGDTTLKFQAVSAAYQVLMDEKRRAAYDATGRVLEEHDDITSYYRSSSDDEGSQHHVPRGKRTRPRNQKQHQQWEDFFHSVFNEIISAGSKHKDAAKLYSGSSQERDDVLKYYTTCKGNLQKVLECVVHAKQEDIERWRKDIIDPAIRNGEVDDFVHVNAAK
jgi:DnaJ family protein C protein 9